MHFNDQSLGGLTRGKLRRDLETGKLATIKPGDIDETVPPSGEGCEECLVAGGWWLHLRRCATCGHIGCCDNSPEQHTTRHQEATGHQVIQSFEPGEDWFYDYRTGEFFEGPALAPPDSHPLEQGVPGPRGSVPPGWQSKLNP